MRIYACYTRWTERDSRQNPGLHGRTCRYRLGSFTGVLGLPVLRNWMIFSKTSFALLMVMSSVKAATCGVMYCESACGSRLTWCRLGVAKTYDVGVLEQLWVDLWLVLEYIQGSPEDYHQQCWRLRIRLGSPFPLSSASTRSCSTTTGPRAGISAARSHRNLHSQTLTMITPSLSSFIVCLLINPRVASVKGVNSKSTSARLNSSSRETKSYGSSSARCLFEYITLNPSPVAISATWEPMLPRPRIPSVLPRQSRALMLGSFHLPARACKNCVDSPRVIVKISDTVASAVRRPTSSGALAKYAPLVLVVRGGLRAGAGAHVEVIQSTSTVSKPAPGFA